MTLNYFEFNLMFLNHINRIFIWSVPSPYARHVPLHRSIKLSFQAVHVDPSAKFLETSSVLHRDFRKFDQKQMPGGPGGAQGAGFLCLER